MLNEKVKGEYAQEYKDDYSELNSNPIFKNLGIGYKDSLNNSLLNNKIDEEFDNENVKEDLNNTQVVTGFDQFKCRGISYDSGVPLSTKYPSMNYNRFGYLYNFTQKNENKAKKNEDRVCSPQQKSNLKIPASMFEEPEVPTIQQIINNPCIFNIRDKLMTGNMNNNYKPTPNTSQYNQKRRKGNNLKSQGHHRNFTLKVGSSYKLDSKRESAINNKFRNGK